MHRIPALLAFLLTFTAAAQQPSPPPAAAKDPPKLEKIEVQGDGLSERRESTASKIVVTCGAVTKLWLQHFEHLERHDRFMDKRFQDGWILEGHHPTNFLRTSGKSS